MRYRVILALAVTALTACSASSQDMAVSRSLFCIEALKNTSQALDRTKTNLDRDLASRTRELEAVSQRFKRTRSRDDKLQLEQLAKSVESLQNSLINVLYQIECFRTDLQDLPVRGEIRSIEITTFYVTNRVASGNGDPYLYYGSGHSDVPAYGRTTVSIPSGHAIGELELPTLWKFERRADAKKHFILTSLQPLSQAGATEQISVALQGATAKTLLLFVHGFNVSFSEAALRTAQLAHDLKFPGVAMFYSWPSAGSTSGYLHDTESAELAKAIFDRVLDDLLPLDLEGVYIVAHSMGNRIVSTALRDRVLAQKSSGKIRELLLAAPDINAEIFRRDIAPVLERMQGTRKTIYVSSRDIALRASKVVHGFRRVGETIDGVLTFPSFETIDASSAAPLSRAFGHSYVMDSVPVLGDIEDLVVWRRAQRERRLRPAGSPPNNYWVFQ